MRHLITAALPFNAEALGADGDVKYYRDAAGVHYVPKRSLDDIILE